MKIIEAAWEEYRDMVVPEDAGRVQVEETRRAFYAGTISVVCALSEMVEPCNISPEMQTVLAVLEADVEAFRNEDRGQDNRH